ncbi:zinc finger protein 664-like [Euwallacea similis]|uniref:zinc finger protein 664-like n=1 Tax=Euwallacea similis TaxID=1736056 RepID=UPI00344BCCC5
MNFQNVCRTCLQTPKSAKIKNIFEEAKHLLGKIEAISSVVIEENSELPNQICEECITNITHFYNFRKVIINTDLDLKARLENLKQTNYAFKPRNNTNGNINFKTENLIDEIDIKVEDLDPEFDAPVQGEDQELLLPVKEDSGNGPKGIYQCTKCELQFDTRVRLKRHKKSAHITAGICNICGKVVRSDNLSKHVRMHSEDPVKCPECGRGFKNNESMRSHKLLHKNKDGYTCEFCGKSFKRKQGHTKHLKLHKDRNDMKITCSQCGKSVYDIKRHIMETHTGRKPYICEFCNKAFARGHALKVHSRQHTNERPYTCNYCEDTFPQKVSLTTHLKSKHGITEVADIDVNVGM